LFAEYVRIQHRVWFIVEKNNFAGSNFVVVEHTCQEKEKQNLSFEKLCCGVLISDVWDQAHEACTLDSERELALVLATHTCVTACFDTTVRIEKTLK